MELHFLCFVWSDIFILNDSWQFTNTHSTCVSIGTASIILEMQESDIDDRSVSCDEFIEDSDGICGESSGIRSGSSWSDLPSINNSSSKQLLAIDPPPEFQDSPSSPYGRSPEFLEFIVNTEEDHPRICRILPYLQKFASQLVNALLDEAISISCKVAWSIHCSQECHPTEKHLQHRTTRWSGPRLCWTPELLSFSPSHRPGSRSSLVSSTRLSSSHNSLSVPAANRADDSSFITSAVSHDVLGTNEISDMYNVPFDSDIYAVPIDVVRPSQSPQRPRRQQRPQRRKRKHLGIPGFGTRSECSQPFNAVARASIFSGHSHSSRLQHIISAEDNGAKRHSMPGTSFLYPSSRGTEPIHMTLHEVRQYLHNLYSSSSDSSEAKGKPNPLTMKSYASFVPKYSNNRFCSDEIDVDRRNSVRNSTGVIINSSNSRKLKKNTFMINIKNKKTKDLCDVSCKESDKDKAKKSPSAKQSFSSNLKQTLCNIFRIRKLPSPDRCQTKKGLPKFMVDQGVHNLPGVSDEDFCGNLVTNKAPFLTRALPPLPSRSETDEVQLSSPEDGPVEAEDNEDVPTEETSMDFALSIEKVKDYGWYWGPISGEAAEKILSNEPDGSFIVRDSSDDHYIFSLTFKLNGGIRHVRIEHDQGNFSFGSCTKFKSHTIVDFIENAVEHSRSGRYLFFLHRRPVLGPMRVQLLHPVSRFKQVQSLQHMCRFVILKLVRRDLISNLPLPRRIIDYLSTPHYYSEQLVEEERSSSKGPSPATDDVSLVSFVSQRPP